MSNRLSSAFALPLTLDEDKVYSARLLNLILFALGAISTLYLLSYLAAGYIDHHVIVCGVILLVLAYCTSGLVLLRKGYVDTLKHPTCLVILSSILLVAVADGSLSSAFAFGGIICVVVIAGLLHHERSLIVYGALAMIEAMWLYYYEYHLRHGGLRVIYSLVMQSGLLTAVTLFLMIAAGDLRRLLQQARASEQLSDQHNRALQQAMFERQFAENQLERFFDISPDPLAIISMDGYLQRSNPAFERTLGYTLEELRAQPITRLLHPDDLRRTLAGVKRLRETGESVKNFENRYRHSDGSYRWFSWNVSYVDGMLYTVARDVTEQKAAQEALRHSEELLNQTGDMAKVGGWEYDIATQTLVWTAQMYQIYGVQKDFAPGRDPVLTFYTPESQAKITTVLERAEKFGEAWDIELELEATTPEGKRRWVRDIGRPKYAGDKIVGLYGTFQDITERKLAEFALLEREQHLQLVLAAAQMDVWLWDLASGQIDLAENSAFQLSFRAESLEEFLALVHPEDRSAVEGAMRASVENGNPYSQEFRLIDANGNLLWLTSLARVLYDDNGKPVTMVGVTQDITARKRADQQQIDLTLAQERAQFLTEFLANISHDLKTPLSVINSSLYLLERLPDTERRSAKIRQIEEQVELLEKYIQDMITISRLEHMPALRKERVNINALLRDIEQHIQPSRERKGLLLHWNLTAEEAHVIADGEELYRAFMNLLENAVNYTPEAGTVTVQTQITEDMIQIEISDTGIGINEGDLPRIFERFYRADHARSLISSGTGLGLAIVKKVIEIHQGEITVRSTPGKGTTFCVRLPRSTIPDMLPTETHATV